MTAPVSVRLDLISFDLDGTLVDTAAEIAEAANRTLCTLGIEQRSVAEITLLIGGGTRQLMTNLLSLCLKSQPEQTVRMPLGQVMQCFDAHYAQTTGTRAAPYPGCVETLASLKAAGVRLACVTNKELHHARAVLQATRLDGYFELTLGGDSLPEKKPHASVLRHAAVVLGASTARTAHVGDSAIDVQAARNAGVAAWAVPYGYNAGQPIINARPDRIFDTLLDVANHVLARHAA